MSPSTKQSIVVAVDTVIFTVKDDQLCALLIQMKKKPYTGLWAFPGGRVEDAETTEQTAIRILKEQTGVSNIYLEQLKTFDAIDRDQLERVISVASFALISDTVQLKTSDKYADVKWWPVKKLPELAYDHKIIAKEAITRLKSRLQYTNIAWSLLPDEFTLTDLQRVYEIILDTTVDKRNFRKRILALDLIVPVGKKRGGEANRPAELYKFKHRKLEYVEIM
ncbi:MAG: NUDIX domain-containing protein [Candidatus Uhrbacteria bacterium]|nr:NUDIX domain-containing protein [Candidatus Uhrbacteria bacterium]